MGDDTVAGGGWGGGGVEEEDTAVGGARQSLIRQVQFTWSCSLLLWCAVPAVKCKCVLL